MLWLKKYNYNNMIIDHNNMRMFTGVKRCINDPDYSFVKKYSHLNKTYFSILSCYMRLCKVIGVINQRYCPHDIIFENSPS